MKTMILLTAILAFSWQVTPAQAQTDDVFIDEGSGDFDMPEFESSDSAESGLPVPMPNPEPADEASQPAETSTADVEEPAAESSDDKPTSQVQTTALKGKEGFKMLKMDCEMRRDPASASPVLIMVKGNRKLWIEEVDGEWVKGFRKKGHGFMSRQCFE